MAVKKRTAGSFTNNVGYDEWVQVTLIRPALIGAVTFLIGLAVGLLIGGVT